MATAVDRVKLGSQGFEVSKQGLGCMGMSHGYGPVKSEQEMIDLIHHALNSGITFLDTSDFYGPHTNEVLVGKAIKGMRDRVEIATKFGVYMDPDTGTRRARGDPEYVRMSCEGSLKRLDIDCIDLYYIHRIDKDVPIEVTIGEMKKLVGEGKVKYLGMSEASSQDIRRAHAVHPITAVQIEWSLWTRDVEEDVIPTCRELGIGIVPFSPLGKGFFAGLDMSKLTDGDFRKMMVPRLQPGNLEKNEVFYRRLVEIGKKHGKTPGQVALAWVHHQGHDVVPIPGTTKVKNLEENIGALSIFFSTEELEEIETAVPIAEVEGDRYAEEHMQMTWRRVQSPPLSSWKV